MKSALTDLVAQSLHYKFQSVLDIGAGNGFASNIYHKHGKTVTATGLCIESYGRSNFPNTITLFEDVLVEDMHVFADSQFDAIWCSHVLEHTQNPGLALNEIHRVLKEDGYLFLIVPEYSPLIVGGHISTGWNLGVLMYNLVLSGFNVREGSFINHCWNVAAFVQKTKTCLPDLRHDDGDIEELNKFFPRELRFRQGVDGRISSHNWYWRGVNRNGARARWYRYKVIDTIHSIIPPLIYYFLKGVKYRFLRRLRNK
jgi:SAM-dependent methyltransferase